MFIILVVYIRPISIGFFVKLSNLNTCLKGQKMTLLFSGDSCWNWVLYYVWNGDDGNKVPLMHAAQLVSPNSCSGLNSDVSMLRCTFDLMTDSKRWAGGRFQVTGGIPSEVGSHRRVVLQAGWLSEFKFYLVLLPSWLSMWSCPLYHHDQPPIRRLTMGTSNFVSFNYKLK